MREIHVIGPPGTGKTYEATQRIRKGRLLRLWCIDNYGG